MGLSDSTPEADGSESCGINGTSRPAMHLVEFVIKRVKMKNVLYGTTALIAAGMLASGSAAAAEKIKLNVGGYFKAFGVYVNEDAANRRSNALVREAEIHFTGKTTLDNGLQVGVNVQLEAETCADQIDESFIYFQGSWGRVNIGAEDGAANTMTYGDVGGVADGGVGTPSFNYIQGATIFVFPDLGGDAEKLTYYTPRFSGFQFGASYTPDRACEAANGASGCNSYSGSQKDDGSDAAVGSVYEFGANWVGNFQGVSVALSGTYGRAEDEAGSNDPKEWSLGAQLGYNNFSIGGVYTDTNDADATAGNDSQRWQIGAQYGMGAWKVGVQYSQAEFEAGADTQKIQNAALEANYVLGPGVNLAGGLRWADVEDDADTAANEKNDGVAVFLGTRLSF